MTDFPKTLIEFRDRHRDSTGQLLHKACGPILIDGNPVAVERGSVKFESGEDQITKVTLTLLPHEVRFNHNTEENN